VNRALHAEWTKFRTVSGPTWLVVSTVVATVIVGAATVGSARCASVGCGVDPAKISFTGVYLGQAVIAILGVLIIGNEYSTGMIRLSLVAMPRRLRVLGAKGLILAGAALVASVVAVAVSAVFGMALLPGRGFTAMHGYASLTSGSDLRAAVGAIVYLTLIALLSLGVTAAVRDSGAAIGVVLGLLFVFPIIAGLTPDATIKRHLEQIGPLTAGLDAQSTIGTANLPLTPWQGLGVVALWAVGALLLGAAVLSFRDA
jgi:ABC-2 type transport system permease protein